MTMYVCIRRDNRKDAIEEQRLSSEFSEILPLTILELSRSNGGRAFPVSGQRVWNSLILADIHRCPHSYY